MNEPIQIADNRRTRRSHRVAPISVAILLPILLAAGCKKEETPAPEITVQAEHPELGAISDHIIADAILAPLAQAAIVPKISSPVKEFYVQRGAKVKEGELLAVLENADLVGAAQDNKGSYEAAQAASRRQPRLRFLKTPRRPSWIMPRPKLTSTSTPAL